MAKTGVGWTASRNPADFGGLATITVAGVKFRVRKNLHIGQNDGDIAVLFQYLIEQFHYRVEPVTLYAAGDDWSYLFKPNTNNPNSLSEHAGGMAVDLNATRHPNNTRWDKNFAAAQRDTIHQIINVEMEGVIDWGGDWTRTVDAMHFQGAEGTASDAGKAKIRRVAEKLRPRLGRAYGPVKTKISISHIQAALRTGTMPTNEATSMDGKQFQKALNKYTGATLTVDGILGKNTRHTTALAQAKLANLPAGKAWPNSGFHPDCDGIAGRQLLTALGFDVIA